MAVQQTPAELEQHLREQMDFLEGDQVEFDAGRRHVAKRMATALRVLLHETASSRSLLGQLGVLTSMQFYDSGGEVNPHNITTTSSLTLIEGQRHGARLDFLMTDLGDVMAEIPELQRFVPARAAREAAFAKANGRPMAKAGDWHLFDLWWTLPVIHTHEGEDFSRKDLVLSVANTDGGSHVDPKLREPYARLSRSNSLKWAVGLADGQQIPLDDPVLPSVRQIAFEVTRSIERQFPQLRP